MRLRTTTALATRAIAAVVAAGCGGSSGSTSSSAAAASPSTTMAASSSSSTSSGAATVKTASSPLGTLLVDAKGRTLYLWEADKGSTSTCNGGCAAAWPPLTTTGHPKAAGGAKASLLGTSKRADGSTEVTYAGHPLYYYVGDTKRWQILCQNVREYGGLWLVVAPSGKFVR
jgi:predicted lipoprotein with Yx(FWY)xxD motif